MYSVMIIDDEQMIRDGLRSIVDWHAHGFEVIGESENGSDGLAAVLENEPDLILTDIRMPGLSGLEMVEQLRENDYEGMIIILTGYSDFEYAKEAISLNVHNYLLKPIDEEELEKDLEDIKQQLDLEKASDEMTLIQKDINLTEVSRKLNLGIKLNDVDLALMHQDTFLNKDDIYYTVILNRDKPGQKTDDSVMNFLENNSLSKVWFSLEECFILVVRNKSFRQLTVVLSEMIKHVYRLTGESVFVTVGSQAKGYSDLRQSYEKAMSLFKRRFLFRDQQVIFWDTYVNKMAGEKRHFIESDYLYGLIEVGNLEAIEVYFDRLEEDLIGSELSAEKVKGMCIKGYIEVKEKLEYNYSSAAKVMAKRQAVIDKIYEMKNLKEIIDFLLVAFEEISREICDGSYDNTIKRLLNYIHKNYDKNLKLEGLARLFNYNSSYLGKIFKTEVGKSFNSYLDEIRLEHAKELLMTEQLKIYEIAERIGYSNVDYFYSKFKKHVGVSPKAYKKEGSSQ